MCPAIISFQMLVRFVSQNKFLKEFQSNFEMIWENSLIFYMREGFFGWFTSKILRVT